jgi:hypothetical protein
MFKIEGKVYQVFLITKEAVFTPRKSHYNSAS